MLQLQVALPACQQANHSSRGFMQIVKGKTFPHEDRQALQQAAQRRCSVSILGDFQDQNG